MRFSLKFFFVLSLLSHIQIKQANISNVYSHGFNCTYLLICDVYKAVDFCIKKTLTIRYLISILCFWKEYLLDF